MIPKPIFVIKYPVYFTDEDADYLGKVIRNIPDFINDYYVLAVRGDREDFDFRVFYEKDFNEVKYEELKKIIYDAAAAKPNRAKIYSWR